MKTNRGTSTINAIIAQQFRMERANRLYRGQSGTTPQRINNDPADVAMMEARSTLEDIRAAKELSDWLTDPWSDEKCLIDIEEV